MPVHERARDAARARGAGELAAWLAAVSGAAGVVRVRVVVGAGDHGDAPPGATAAALAESLRGRGDELDAVAVDAGVAGGAAGDPRLVRPALAPSRGPGPEPALGVGEVALAVDTGRDLAARAAADGVSVVVASGLGHGTDGAARALAGALTGATPADHGPLGALRRLGGGEIAVLCGVALGTGEHGLGCVCAGPAAIAAGAVAAAVEPDLRPRLIAYGLSPADDALAGDLGLATVLPPAAGGRALRDVVAAVGAGPRAR